MTMTVQSARRTLEPFFAPRVIAVVGANRERGSIGSEIFCAGTAARRRSTRPRIA